MKLLHGSFSCPLLFDAMEHKTVDDAEEFLRNAYKYFALDDSTEEWKLFLSIMIRIDKVAKW